MTAAGRQTGDVPAICVSSTNPYEPVRLLYAWYRWRRALARGDER